MKYNRKFQAVLIATLILFLAVTSFVNAARTITVPLLVNVQKGVTITDDQIADMVKEANKLLKQADIQIKFNKKTDIKNPYNDGVNNNDKIEKGEDKTLDPKAVKELESHTGKKGHGVKVVISNEIHGKSGTLGLAAHDPKSPVIYIKSGQTAKKGGNTLAHEFAHIFTLGGYHKVTDTENADKSGHINKPNNLMHPTSNGEKLTEDQKEELRKGAARNGNKEGILTYCWRSIASLFNYQSPNPEELMIGAISHLLEEGLYRQDFRFGGNVTQGDPVMLVAAFDVDNNPGTGRDILLPDGSTAFGMDRTLEVIVDGDPLAGGMATANILDEVGNPILAPDVEYEHVPKIIDDWVDPNSYIIYDRVTVHIDQGLLPLDPVFSSAVVYSYLMSDPLQNDKLPIIEIEMPTDPEPVVILDRYEALPGDLITVTGEHFYPNDPNVFLQFNDEEIDFYPSDASGACTAILQVPVDVVPGRHFVNMNTNDPIGGFETKYAFAVLEVIANYDLVDLAGLQKTWLLYEDDAGFDQNFNYIDDNVIDMDDLLVFCRNWLNLPAGP